MMVLLTGGLRGTAGGSDILPSITQKDEGPHHRDDDHEDEGGPGHAEVQHGELGLVTLGAALVILLAEFLDAGHSEALQGIGLTLSNSFLATREGQDVRRQSGRHVPVALVCIAAVQEGP